MYKKYKNFHRLFKKNANMRYVFMKIKLFKIVMMEQVQ